MKQKTLTIQLPKCLQHVKIVDNRGVSRNGQGAEIDLVNQDNGSVQQSRQVAAEAEQRQQQLVRTTSILEALAKHIEQSLGGLLTTYRQEIAALAVDIARRVVQGRIENNDYEITAMIENALSGLTVSPDVVVYMHPDDLAVCERVQQDHPDGPLHALHFMADGSLGPSDFRMETQRGVIRSVAREKLDKIEKALIRAGEVDG